MSWEDREGRRAKESRKGEQVQLLKLSCIIHAETSPASPQVCRGTGEREDEETKKERDEEKKERKVRKLRGIRSTTQEGIALGVQT